MKFLFKMILSISVVFNILLEATDLNNKKMTEEEFVKEMIRLEVRLLENKDYRDYSEVIKLYEKYCESDYSNACYYLANRYVQGIVVIQDINKAIALYEKAFSLGYYHSYITLGKLYKDGKLLKKDDKKAEYYYEQLCLKDKSLCGLNKGQTKEIVYKRIETLKSYEYCGEGLNPMYCDSIAKIYEEYNDIENAIKYYDMGCIYNFATICVGLSRLLMKQGNFEKAEEKLNFACSDGSEEACLELGNLYKNKDEEKSKKFYKRACDLGFLKACE